MDFWNMTNIKKVLLWFICSRGDGCFYCTEMASLWLLTPGGHDPPPSRLKPQMQNSTWCQRADTAAGLSLSVCSRLTFDLCTDSTGGYGGGQHEHGTVCCRTFASRCLFMDVLHIVIFRITRADLNWRNIWCEYLDWRLKMDHKFVGFRFA